LDEQLKEYILEWRKQRAKEEEELKVLKEKQAKRKVINFCGLQLENEQLSRRLFLEKGYHCRDHDDIYCYKKITVSDSRRRFPLTILIMSLFFKKCVEVYLSTDYVMLMVPSP